MLRELARRLPDNTVFTFVYSGNQIVGFTFWLISDQTFHALLVGMNYDVNSKCELYFNLSYQSMDFGLKRRAQEVCIGQSTDRLQTSQAWLLSGADVDLCQRRTMVNAPGAEVRLRVDISCPTDYVSP